MPASTHEGSPSARRSASLSASLHEEASHRPPSQRVRLDPTAPMRAQIFRYLRPLEGCGHAREQPVCRIGRGAERCVRRRWSPPPPRSDAARSPQLAVTPPLWHGRAACGISCSPSASSRAVWPAPTKTPGRPKDLEYAARACIAAPRPPNLEVVLVLDLG